jgi:hypothetical protein
MLLKFSAFGQEVNSFKTFAFKGSESKRFDTFSRYSLSELLTTTSVI